MLKLLWNKIKYYFGLRHIIISKMYDNTNDVIVKYEKYLKIFLNIFLGVILLQFSLFIWKEWEILKIFIFLIWIYITYFLFETMKEVIIDINETKEEKFIKYSIIFFWLNISCAFFFIWSSFMKYVFLDFKIYL